MNKKSLRFTGIAVAAATFVSGIATMSVAATQANGSYGAMHIWNNAFDPSTLVAPATSMLWEGELVASGSSSFADTPIVCPSSATKSQVFISERTKETVSADWAHAGDKIAFASGKDVLEQNITPASIPKTDSADAEAGGDWSLGIACLNALDVVQAVYYRYITVTAGSGGTPTRFVAAETTDAVVEPTATPTPVDPTLTGSIALSAATLDAVNGTLALSVPASAAATFNTPTLVNNKSTTTGTLPFVTVSDGRVVTKQGWTLSADVADFTSGVSPNVITIPKSALGIAPSISAGSTTAAGALAGTATVAGSATYPFTFAHAVANNTVGNTVVGGALTFVAPQEKAAGTYTSTLTLTLASK
jgi:hypothetical protein